MMPDATLSVNARIAARVDELRTARLAMQLDRPVMFHNSTQKTARYAVVIAMDPPVRA
jgi:hypothetical protein